MLTCPMCKKSFAALTRQCPRCRTDLSLLVDYVEHRQEGLMRAEQFTRQGRLGEAVWAYLEVLEVDPDNAQARRQVGQVVTAVRQFDHAAPGQRWLQRLRRQARFRHWLDLETSRTSSVSLARLALAAALVLLGLLVGYRLGSPATRPPGEGPSLPSKDVVSP